MRLGLPILLAVLLLGWTATAATAAAAPAPTVLATAQFRPLFVEAVCRNAPWPKEKLVVENITARPDTLAVPAGEITYRVTNRPQAKYLGSKSLTLVVLVNGKEAGSIKMTGDLQLYDQVLCTTRRMRRHDTVHAGDLKLVRQNVTMLGSDLARDPSKAIGKRLTTSLRPGSVLRTTQLESPPLVNRGDLVTIIARTDHLRVTVPGEAKDGGAQGDLIRVKNLMSRKALFAKVVGNGTVEVEF